MVDGNFKDWYRVNAPDLNARRRKRYDKDPEYREAVKKLNTRARKKQRNKFKEEKLAEAEAIKMRTSVGAWKTVDVEVDGVVIPMFTIGAIARVLGRSISTLRVWEKNGLLPETPYRANNGARLYTVETIEHMHAVLAKEGKLQPEFVQERKAPQFVVKRVKLATGRTRKLRLYRIGTLARVVRRSPVSLLNLERRDRLPITPLRSSLSSSTNASGALCVLRIIPCLTHWRSTIS